MCEIVRHFVTRELCRNQGILGYEELYKKVGKKFKNADRLLNDVLTKNNMFVIISGKEKREASVIAKTSLRLCQNRPGNCDGCGDLHLCRYFVCGNCKYRNKCKNSHDLDTDYNTEVLRKVELQNLEQDELFHLLLQNDPYLLPEICKHYNRGSGDYGCCRFKEGCTNLHICLDFVLGSCEFGPACKRTHAFNLTATKILRGRGFGRGSKETLLKIYRNQHLITSSAGRTEPSDMSEVNGEEICLFHLRNQCTFGENCFRVHFHLPYKWQVLDRDGSTWKYLPNTEDIEKAYCNPENNRSLGPCPVDFRTMRCGSAKVQRLSTISSVSKPPDFILTTDWLWYWKDDQGQWTEYKHEASGQGTDSVTSQCLEKVYQEDVDGDTEFRVGDHRYILRFKDMVEYSVTFKTEREVRRRPRFLSSQEVKEKVESESQEAAESSDDHDSGHSDEESLSDI
ncbi:hypothetical protein AGOR_G00231000 [Albula goreensis]|uniref:Uncharacterized protein n=1 Tax=Albula goreensis TaxID=1534307 RepID=A0A8T3CKY6_9TELE|nr:hypothetical protein AGOR_G00231000 [Albula goreensis]